MQAAGEPGVFDLETAVLDDLQARVERGARRAVVPQSQLEPDDFGADGDGLVDDAWDGVRGAEDVDTFQEGAFWASDGKTSLEPIARAAE